MFKALLPKEYVFYDFFEEHSKIIIETCLELKEFVDGKKNITETTTTIKQLERKADEITHKCTNALIQTFVTPMERTDIHMLLKRMDDIIDSIYGALTRITLYGVEELRSEVIEQTEVLIKAVYEIELAVKSLRKMKEVQNIRDRCDKIHQFENEGDIIHRAAIIRLFKETDAVYIIKWKEIFDRIERAMDRCEDVSNIILRILIAST